MTYVAQFLHRYPEPRGVEETVPTIQGEFQKLACWLAETTNRLQRLIDTNSLPTDYKVADRPPGLTDIHASPCESAFDLHDYYPTSHPGLPGVPR